MKSPITTSLTFQDGNAEKAMNLYVSVFENAKIHNIIRWGENAPVAEGKIMQARFEINESLFLCSDSPAVHDWSFSPASTLYIECDDDTEIEHLTSQLSKNGQIMMPLDNYGFSQKFTLFTDAFGVSWQLNLA